MSAIVKSNEEIRHFCSACGNEVDESCADHPAAMVDSIICPKSLDRFTRTFGVDSTWKRVGRKAVSA